jgi:signal transduction histidine kinase
MATVASLEQVRARQRDVSRLLRMLVLLVAVLVEVGGVASRPGPGTAGEHLVVLLALAGFAVGAVGVLLSEDGSPGRSAVFIVVIIAASAVLVAVQPKGPASLGAFVAVAVTAMRVRGTAGGAIVVFAMLALPVAELLGGEHSVEAIVLDETGVLAFYVMAVLANWLREGQQRAEQLLSELTQSRAAQARAAALAERQRLAREMHDVLAHSLSGLALELEGGRLLAESKHTDLEVIEKLEHAHRLAKSGLAEARRAIGLLRDEELPGPDGLPQLLHQLGHDTAIRTSFRSTGLKRTLAPEAQLTLYRTAQEALTNVRKHARCTRVDMQLDFESHSTRLTIEDFGRGGHLEPQRDNGGYGLTGMRERAELIGGSLTAGHTSTGFRVELWIPS